MAFVVEDGTGKSDANSYITTAEGDSYWTDRGGNATWTALTADEKEDALVKATDYIERKYRWSIGRRANEDQRLGWPRRYAYDADDYQFESDEIPLKLKEATAEMAVRTAAGDVLEDETDQRVVQESVTGAVSVTYADGGTRKRTLYRVIDMLLADLAYGASGRRVVRG